MKLDNGTPSDADLYPDHVMTFGTPLSLELPIAGADARKMAEKIQQLGSDVERIIPIHGTDASMDALKKGVAVRTKYATASSN